MRDVAELPGNLRCGLRKFVWVHGDMDELVARREVIKGSKELELALEGLAFPGK